MSPERVEGARRGRRPGKPDTREVIVDAARELFAQKGFAGTSMRAVARAADVDPALVHHYFDDKVALLMATMSIGFNPRAAIHHVIQGDLNAIAPRGLAFVVSLYDSPIGDAIHEAFQRDAHVATVLFEMVLSEYSAVLTAALPNLTDAERSRRTALVQDVIGGLALARLLLRVGPLATMSPDDVVANLAPMLQAAIDGRVGPGR